MSDRHYTSGVNATFQEGAELDIKGVIDGLGRVDCRENSKRVTVRITEEHAETLRLLSDLTGRSVTHIAETFLREILQEAAAITGSRIITE